MAISRDQYVEKVAERLGFPVDLPQLYGPVPPEWRALIEKQFDRREPIQMAARFVVEALQLPRRERF